MNLSGLSKQVVLLMKLIVSKNTSVFKAFAFLENREVNAWLYLLHLILKMMGQVYQGYEEF